MMIKLEMKNYNTILIEKQPKYQLCHQTKFRNMSILLVKQQIIEQAKFTHSLLGKAFEKQIKTIEYKEEKQVKALNTVKSDNNNNNNNNNNNKLTIEIIKLINFLNEIRQIMYSLYQSKEITKKVYNNLIKSL